MRLIHTETLELFEFFGNDIPRYAILSHTWGQEEMSLKDWKRRDAAKEKTGFSKINMACRQALADDVKYLWVDTNCIDKRSSAELSEAINSMFGWYKNAFVCYAYLADVEPRPSGALTEDYRSQFRLSRWFTRGWTLQELLAPPHVVFFAKDWSKIANRYDVADEISTATGIPEEYLVNWRTPVASASVARRMSWLSGRETTRIEDMAYCVMGIFDINMPLLYGEGPKAFTRLQEEIIRKSTDHTIFCWNWTEMVPSKWASLLAPCPQAFMNSGDYVRTQESTVTDSLTFTMTNAGLSIHFPVVRAFSYHFGVLNATQVINDQEKSEMRACVPIRDCVEYSIDTKGVMRRKPFPPSPLLLHHDWAVRQLLLYIRSSPDLANSTYNDLFYGNIRRHVGCSILLLFDDTHQVFQSDPSATNFERRFYDRISLTKEAQRPMQIEVSPGNCFDRSTSLIMLDNTHLINGVLIRLGHHERLSVFFLGAELSPSKRVLRRFGGVVPDSELMSDHPQGLDVLLDIMLKRLRNGSDQVSWWRSSETSDYSTVTGIGFELGDEILVDNNSILPVFFTCDSGDLAVINKFEDGEGAERNAPA